MFQEYTSKDTSINTVNAIYKKGYFKEGDEILDFGGGKYDSNIEYLSWKWELNTLYMTLIIVVIYIIRL